MPMAGPMDGVKVVELGVWVAGPAAGGILCDWGADVIKIEPPSGDPARTFQRMLGGDMPTNPVFELDNRSKRSVVVDLSRTEGRAVATDIIARADVFLTNLRLGALDRLGLDYESLAARNPALVYCAITGYGVEGPDAGPSGLRHSRFLGPFGYRRSTHPTGRGPALPAGGNGRPQRGPGRGGSHQRGPVPPGTHRRWPNGVHFTVPGGHVHHRIRHQRAADVGVVDGGGNPGGDGQPGHQQLHRGRRAAVLGGWTRRRPPLASPGPSGGPPRMDRRRAVRHRPGSSDQCRRVDRRAGRGVRHPSPGGVG